MKNVTTLIKWLSTLAFIFCIFAIFTILRTPSAGSYEISIYSEYPWYTWLFIFATLILGECVILTDLLYNREKRQKLWLLGLLAIIITNTLLLFMPFIRGYMTYGREDPLSHIGYIKDIVSNGQFGKSNYYPISHILSSVIHYLTGIEIHHVVNLIPPFFSLFYIFSTILLGKEIFKKKSSIILLTMIASILLFSRENLRFAPSVQSFFFTPFLLWIYTKANSSRCFIWFAFFAMLLFLLIFFHPLTFLFFIVTLAVLWLSSSIYSKLVYLRNHKNSRFKNSLITTKTSSNSNVLTAILIIGTVIVCLIWFFSFPKIQSNFASMMPGAGSGKSIVVSYSDTITYPNFLSFIKIIFSRYGQNIVMGIASFILTLYFINSWRRNRLKEKLKVPHIFFTLGFITFLSLSALFSLKYLVIPWERVFKYTTFFSTGLIALGFAYYFYSSKCKRIYSKKLLKTILILLFVIILIGFSLFNLYFSPISSKHNLQVSHSEFQGMKWFFNNRQTNILIKDIPGIRQIRFHDAIYGSDIVKPSIRARVSLTQKPDHFGYNEVNSLGTYYGVIGDVNNDNTVDITDFYLVDSYVTGYLYWDVSGDGQINASDLSLVLVYMGESGAPHWNRADVNYDGKVDIHDIILVIQHFNETYATSWDFIATLTPLKENEFLRRADTNGDLSITVKDSDIIKEFLSWTGYYFPQSQRYVLVNKLGRELYPSAYPGFEKYWRYSPQDFAKLERDETIIKIFNDGDLKIYLTVPEGI